MARYIQDEVASIADSPTDGEDITVVVGVGEGSLSTVKERARRANASNVEELPFHSLRIRLPQTRLGELFNMSGVQSIEKDDGLEVLSGN